MFTKTVEPIMSNATTFVSVNKQPVQNELFQIYKYFLRTALYFKNKQLEILNRDHTHTYSTSDLKRKNNCKTTSQVLKI